MRAAQHQTIGCAVALEVLGQILADHGLGDGPFGQPFFHHGNEERAGHRGDGGCGSLSGNRPVEGAGAAGALGGGDDDAPAGRQGGGLLGPGIDHAQDQKIGKMLGQGGGGMGRGGVAGQDQHFYVLRPEKSRRPQHILNNRLRRFGSIG